MENTADSCSLLIEPQPFSAFELNDVAYDRIYRKVFSSLRYYGTCILNDKFTIDNIVQEAFLKLWNYRETITSIDHAKAFLKQNIKWECYSYIRHPVSRFHRRFTYLDAIDNFDTVFGLSEPEPDDEQDELTQRQLKAISDMIPFLAEGREKNLLKLYYIDGLSYKQIAHRHDISTAAASLGVRSGVEKLRSMIVRPQQLFAETKVSALMDANKRVWLHDIKGLTKEQSQIYRLRVECKYGFDRIARSLDLPLAYVQREYVRAWKVVNGQKEKKSSLSGAVLRSHKPVAFLIA